MVPHFSRSFRFAIAAILLFAAPGGLRAVSSTPTPTLTNPATNQQIGDNSALNYSLPVAALAGSAKLTFDNGSGTPTVFTIGSSGLSAGAHSLSLKLSNPTIYGPANIASVTGPAITDGTYSVTLSYQDTAGDPAASATSTGVIVDTAAQTPTLTAPVRFGKAGRSLAIDFTLPEAAFRGSVTLTFFDTNNFPYIITFAGTEETVGQHTFTIDPTNPTASAHVASGAAIPDGAYIGVALQYNDLLGNRGTVEFVKDVDPAFTIDTVTQAPTLTKPLADAISLNPMPLQFTLPEAALAGSVMVIFDDGTNMRTLHIKDGVTSPSFDVGDPGASPDVTSVDGGDAIPDGTYTVTLSYQDALGNPANTVAHTGVIIDGTAPQISVPAATPTRRAPAGTLGDYTTLAQVTDAHPGSVTQEPAIGSAITAGVQTITLTATDAAGNDASADFDLDVRPTNAPSAKVVAAGVGALGDAAPDAGVNGIPGGPVAGSKLVSLGVPCVDDLGNICYLAKWQSSPKSKGSGLFYRDAGTGSTNCLLGVGGDAAPVMDAKVVSLADPVGSAGNVAMLGKIKIGAKTIPAVFSNAAAGRAPVVIAQAGETATADGAKFKTFKAVEVAGSYVGLLAQLAPGSGSPTKTTPENDTGLWVKDGGDPFKLVLREGQEVATGKKIKTLIAFLPGNGSPGQGRGWLRQQPAGGALALALCLFADKTQGIVTVDAATPATPTLLTYSGLTGIGGPFVPGVANPTFASFGLPTRNPAGDTLFSAALTADATSGITKANASGVFAGPTVGGYYGVIARVGDPAGATGGNFSQIKDPALSDDGTFAFAATIKGTGITAPATATLWWQPSGKAFQILAQGGQRAGSDVASDVHWKSFDSLAVPGGFRGPIFAATLVTNKTSVTPANASGVWAVDFIGGIRKLFRTGDPIDLGTPATPLVKTLKSFTLLKATVGSTGVTRSFNDAAQVVWLATFTDKTTAIVTTEVP